MLIPTKHAGYIAGRRVYPGGGKGGGGGGGGQAAPTPDPRIGIAAERQIQLAEKQYDDFSTNYAPFLKDQMGQGIRIADEQNKRQGELQQYQLARSKIYDDRWDKTQVPLEDQIVKTARDYNEPAEQERMAAQAGADVNSAYEMSDRMMSRDLASRGVNPNSGNYIDLKTANAVQRAGVASAAVNKTRQAAKDIGWARLGEAAALGRGLPGFGSTSASLSMGAGQAAFGAGTAGVGLVGGASGANNAGYTAGGGLYSSAASGLNSQFGNQVSAFSAQTQADSARAANDPFNAILGGAAGYGIKWAAAPASGVPGSQTNLGRLFS